MAQRSLTGAINNSVNNTIDQDTAHAVTSDVSISDLADNGSIIFQISSVLHIGVLSSISGLGILAAQVAPTGEHFCGVNIVDIGNFSHEVQRLSGTLSALVLGAANGNVSIVNLNSKAGVSSPLIGHDIELLGILSGPESNIASSRSDIVRSLGSGKLEIHAVFGLGVVLGIVSVKLHDFVVGPQGNSESHGSQAQNHNQAQNQSNNFLHVLFPPKNFFVKDVFRFYGCQYTINFAAVKAFAGFVSKV